MKSIKRFFMSALLLTVSALIMRSISVSFGAYVSKTAGAEAMGVFSQIMSVFGFALTIATSGINLAATRMVSEALGTGDEGLVYKSMKKCVSYCLVFSLFSGAVLFLFSRIIGIMILGDKRTVFPLKILAVALPFISLTSAFGGYFTAVRRVYKSTIYSVLEQLIKIFFTVKMFEIFIHRGVEYACISLVAADAISEFSAFSMSALMYLHDRKKHVKRTFTSVPDKEVSKKLYSISLPVAVSTYLRSGLLTIEHILIPKCLIKSGLLREVALSSYGMLHSMVMPVVLFPTAILSSFAGLLIPELAEVKIKRKKAAVQNIAELAFRYSLLFSFAISGLLICFSGELGLLVYNSREVSQYIRLIAPLVPIMYLDSVTDAMLKGLGEQVYSMNVNIIDALVSIILVMVLLPKFGISGYIATLYITEIINATLSILKLLQTSLMRPRIYKWCIAPLISITGAVAVTRLAFGVVPTSFGMLIDTVLGCITVVLFYLLLTRTTGAFTKRDRLWLNYALGLKRCSEDRFEMKPHAQKYSEKRAKERLRSIQKC